MDGMLSEEEIKALMGEEAYSKLHEGESESPKEKIDETPKVEEPKSSSTSQVMHFGTNLIPVIGAGEVHKVEPKPDGTIDTAASILSMGETPKNTVAENEIVSEEKVDAKTNTTVEEVPQTPMVKVEEYPKSEFSSVETITEPEDAPMADFSEIATPDFKGIHTRQKTIIEEASEAEKKSEETSERISNPEVDPTSSFGDSFGTTPEGESAEGMEGTSTEEGSSDDTDDGAKSEEEKSKSEKMGEDAKKMFSEREDMDLDSDTFTRRGSDMDIYLSLIANAFRACWRGLGSKFNLNAFVESLRENWTVSELKVLAMYIYEDVMDENSYISPRVNALSPFIFGRASSPRDIGFNRYFHNIITEHKGSLLNATYWNILVAGSTKTWRDIMPLGPKISGPASRMYYLYAHYDTDDTSGMSMLKKAVTAQSGLRGGIFGKTLPLGTSVHGIKKAEKVFIWSPEFYVRKDEDVRLWWRYCIVAVNRGNDEDGVYRGMFFSYKPTQGGPNTIEHCAFFECMNGIGQFDAKVSHTFAMNYQLKLADGSQAPTGKESPLRRATRFISAPDEFYKEGNDYHKFLDKWMREVMKIDKEKFAEKEGTTDESIGDESKEAEGVSE